MVEPVAQSRPGAREPTQGHNIWHIVIAMFIFPPFGVYLLYGGYDIQVGLNVLAWFLFITPGVSLTLLIISLALLNLTFLPIPLPANCPAAYIHGFVLLIWKKAWPKFVPQFREVRDHIQETGYILAESWVTAVETKAHNFMEGLADKLKSRDAAPDSAAGPPA